MSKILTAMLAAGFCLVQRSQRRKLPIRSVGRPIDEHAGYHGGGFAAPDGRPYQAGSGYTSLEQEVIVLLVSEDQTASAEGERTSVGE